jgi:hypothetical protein
MGFTLSFSWKEAHKSPRAPSGVSYGNVQFLRKTFITLVTAREEKVEDTNRQTDTQKINPCYRQLVYIFVDIFDKFCLQK